MRVSYTPQDSSGARGGGTNVFEADAHAPDTSEIQAQRLSAEGAVMSLEAAERAVREGDLDAALDTFRNRSARRRRTSSCASSCSSSCACSGSGSARSPSSNVAADLDAKTLAMAQMYREAIQCEVLRADVFAGQEIARRLRRARPMARAAHRVAARHWDASRGRSRRPARTRLRGRPAVSRLDRRAALRVDRRRRHAAWARCCEAVVNGRYYWVPFAASPASISRRRPTCATSSGCRPTCSSPTAARRSP